MGLLSEGRPLSWEETKALADHVRKHGVQQFIHLFRKLETRKEDSLKWGDEVEYVLVKMDKETKSCKLLLKAEELLKQLQIPELRGDKDLPSLWRPEYASYMIEGTPGGPYVHDISEFNKVEENMRKRRKEVQALLGKDEYVFSLTAYPRMGCENFTEPETSPDPNNSVTRSLFWPDPAIFCGHPRFKTLTRNIRCRRGEKVAINLPVFQDDNTKDPHEILVEKYGAEAAKASKPGHIYMDAMGFGMGQSCLQLTFQGNNLKESVSLYDQLAPLCPIMLAITASNPISKGILAATDCRWDTIAASVDCRTRQERGQEPISDGAKFGAINKSRYGSVSSFLSDCSLKCKDGKNDIDLVYDPETYQILKEAGINELMAKHISHLFIRDTVSLFSEKVDQNDEEDTDHFENIQSTNWQSMRFKPPPPNSDIGWRVEFRPCELQISDYENAAVACFVVLLTRVILSYGYNLLVPISKIDENMKRAQKMDAIVKEKFFFRTNITATCDGTEENEQQAIIEEMTIDQIMNGAPEFQFPGLLPLVQDYLRNIEVETDTMCTLSRYWLYLQKKANGQRITNARFIRNFVTQHPSYKKDSVVTEEITYDLLSTLNRIEKGDIPLCDALKSSSPE